MISIQYFPVKDNSLASKNCILCKFGMAGEPGIQMEKVFPREGSVPRQNRKTVFYTSTVFKAILQKVTKNAVLGCKMPENTSSFWPYML